MEARDVSLIPNYYYSMQDPRTLPYLYPESLNIVVYAKKVQTFYYFQMLELAQDLAHRSGYILLPWNCMHWQRAKKFGVQRKIKIGRKSFFLMRTDELTKGERKKLLQYIDELNEGE
ncbi:hypothetical protein FH966_14735 [Lentibacillus cibarius]|uniref:Uncharacterized protein n=1 Tax=Lentibacillus cibarius TaxID=2583219 RepID=A0A549YLU5_9BACI|nr:hypothetical protein [Lentibacillus cibarius]TRM08785.1 hypothetical protein FH966_16550 [Lentibacillus cibarius]TRM08812.1 hypothetical protein FH966_16695 [Lentibacillus cibarius]TRM12859.1 hypothetical protein FH966_14735 [Lentibacillus cibarius]